MERQKRIAELLQSFHCPMNWKVPDIPPKRMIEKIELKLSETEEEGMFKWHKFVLTLLLCSEYYKSEDYEKALEKQKQCETVINIPDSKGQYDKFYHDTKPGLSHVLMACKCHILHATGDYESLEDILKEIPKYEDINDQSKATLLGIQSSLSMEYGHKGNQIGLELIEKAIELNPDEAEWQFLLGRCLGRLRRIENFTHVPSDRELKALDRAYLLSGNPSYLTFMGTACREAAHHVLYTNGTFMDDEFKKAHSLFSAALEKTGNCSHVLSRCAFGFWKLPDPYHDVKLAKKCAQQALEISPRNVMANHIAGIISDLHDKDYQKAEEYYKKSGEGGAYGAFMNLIQMRFRQEKTYDPVPDLEYVLKKFPQEPRLSQTIAHIGSAHLFLKDDLSAAIDNWIDIINDEKPDSEPLDNYICPFLKTRSSVNMYEVIINEIRLALKENKASNDDKLKFHQVYQRCIEKQPDLSELLLSPPLSWKEKHCLKKRHSNTVNSNRGKGFWKVSQGDTSKNWRERGRGMSQDLGRSESVNCGGGENRSWRETGRGRRGRSMEHENKSVQMYEKKENIKTNLKNGRESADLNKTESRVDSSENNVGNEQYATHGTRRDSSQNNNGSEQHGARRGAFDSSRGRGSTNVNSLELNWRLRIE